jgi:hypothetical protein
MRTVAQSKTSTKSKTNTRKTVKAPSHKTKSSSGKSSGTKPSRNAGEGEVTIDRRRADGRRGNDQPAEAAPSAGLPTRLERRKKVNRRRQIDPTTCERDYSDDEVQFMNALDDYKRASGRMFPTCSEVLEVVRSLGYVRLSPSELAAHMPVEVASIAMEDSVPADVEMLEIED